MKLILLIYHAYQCAHTGISVMFIWFNKLSKQEASVWVLTSITWVLKKNLLQKYLWGNSTWNKEFQNVFRREMLSNNKRKGEDKFCLFESYMLTPLILILGKSSEVKKKKRLKYFQLVRKRYKMKKVTI